MPSTATEPSVASQVREWVDAAAPGDILDARTAPGAPSNATRVALSQLAGEAYPEIVFVRRHIYWKHPFGEGTPAPIGTGPAMAPAALHIAGAGAGMAGYSAARLFHWTAQLMLAPEIAVVGRPPRGFETVVWFHSRSNTQRRRLNHHEVALLEATIGFVRHGFDIEYRPGHWWECDLTTHHESECYWDWSDAMEVFAERRLSGNSDMWNFDEQRLVDVAANERMGGQEMRSKISDLADLIRDHKRRASTTP